MNVHEGMTVGPYRVMDRLGRSGMAAVYRAYRAGQVRKLLLDTADDDRLVAR